MANLRNLIDGLTLEAASPVPTKGMKPQADGAFPQQNGSQPQPNQKPGSYPSPAGQHVANNIQDPYGATKDELDDLNQAKMNYEMKKAQMQMKLQPVQSVVQGIQQMHEMQDPNQMQPNPMDQSMGYQDPNDPMQTMGNPPNMSQTPGAMQPGMPAGQPIGAPGVAPGMPKEAIRPFKLGQPSPGMGNPASMAGFPSAGPSQFNPAAPKPKGAGSLPGAKGPGDPKVGNQIKKAQNGGKKGGNGNSSSSGKVAIHVHADSVSSSPAKRTLASYAGADALRSSGNKEDEDEGDCNACSDKMKAAKTWPQGAMDAYGTSQGVEKAWEVRQRGSTNPQTKERYSPSQKNNYGWKKQSWMDGPIFRQAKEQTGKKNLNAYGTSDGVTKEWQERARKMADAYLRQEGSFKKAPAQPPKSKSSAKSKFFNLIQKLSPQEMEAAKLSMKKRKKLSKSQFVFPKRGPGSGSYPIPDAKHGRIAKALVKMHGNPSEVARVNKAVKTKFGFTAAKSTGGIFAVSPPGWKNSTERMKKHKDITNPFALAWWMKNQGDTPHPKYPKKK